MFLGDATTKKLKAMELREKKRRNVAGKKNEGQCLGPFVVDGARDRHSLS